MTREERENAIRCLKLWIEKEPYIQTYKTCLEALEQSMPTMVYPQVDGITPTVVAQADGEKTCGTCRNEDTYHCAECENKSDYEQAQAEVNAHVIQSALDNGTNTVIGTAQADGEYILKSEAIRVASGYCHPSNIAKELEKLPSVAIPANKGLIRAIQSVIDSSDFPEDKVHRVELMIRGESMDKEYTGYNDKDGNPIYVGDEIKFRDKGFSMSGRGIVIRNTEKILRGDYIIQDTRTECRTRNIGRQYPFYDNVKYTIVR